MAVYSGLASVRDDFRCSLCVQKHTFHCEHDTPYRDQLLGSYDSSKPHSVSSNSRREPRRTRPSKTPPTSENTRHTTPGKSSTSKSKSKSHSISSSNSNSNPNASMHNQQSRQPSIPNTNPHANTNTNMQHSIKRNEQKKKGGCTIL
ncbi:unnamed protein product [Rotaria magnacalcarata]|uniref:Uncharacterized protein n=1 Tax=Rotaria magnacalcarata TaxID=392030 RepID=A0A815SEK4_9BILA|nr:unnamed protein product [Rotaria magnacalcarata]CAF1487092.1 unnamed protein product [Rotaria magnacalcarata]CAF2152123.1 unnamed protein product [Rotaria magnacalcarata]CAF3953358.1 unnamed protein product [Rotaria magnacalcarata]CAF3961929.1 unnamed protein product [Rotaria magnacalcarata]